MFNMLLLQGIYSVTNFNEKNLSKNNIYFYVNILKSRLKILSEKIIQIY